MLPIDAEMSKLPVKYVRYVDDIRVFAKDSLGAQSAAIKLEQLCRESGLIPQGGKFSIQKATKAKDVMGQLPSLSEDSEEEEIDVTDAEKMFRQSLEGKPLRVKDKTRFRYVLYRAPASAKILGWCIKLLPLHPEHIDAFIAYFGNYSRSKPLERAICQLLQDGVPHDYVRGQLWHVIARIGGDNTLAAMESRARAEYRDRKNCPVHAWGLLHFLLKCEDAGFGKHLRLVPGSHWLPRALLPPVFPERAFEANAAVPKLLLMKNLESGIAIAREMRNRGVVLSEIGLRQNQLDGRVQTVLKGLGIIQRRRNHLVDEVGKILGRRFGIQVEGVWPRLLGSEYEHGLQLLIEADPCYGPNRSQWLQVINSFNHMVCRAFIQWLHNNNMAGACALFKPDGGQTKFGNNVQPNAQFDSAYPVIASAFRESNNRRNRLPGSHPYDERGGARNEWLKLAEQRVLAGKLQRAYEQIFQVLN